MKTKWNMNARLYQNNRETEMKDADKSISELMDLMKADSDEFFDNRPTLTIGRSGKHYYDDPVDMDIEEMPKGEWDEIVEAQKAERAKIGFPDQGHPVKGGFKESTGEITVEVTPQTEWDENT